MTQNTRTEKRTHDTTDTRQIISDIPRKKKRSRTVYSWFEGPYNSTRGEAALWIAVITQAMMDALTRSTHPENLYHKQAAIQWLTGNSRDFFLVCLFAGLDPDYVRRRAKQALVSPVAWRAAPGQGKRYLERRAYRQRLKKMRTIKNAPMKDDTLPARQPVAMGQVIAGPWR